VAGSLDLALKVAAGAPGNALNAPLAFGGAVRAFGAAVVVTAEDDASEVHRRLQRLDPEERRRAFGQRLIVVPLPNAGGPMPLVVAGKNGPTSTPQYDDLRQQLLRIPELRLVVLDPLSSFMRIDITADPGAGTFAMGLLAMLATETGACIMIAHHMRKPSNGKPITSAEQARDAIRGSTALVDGVRVAYALWAADPKHQKHVWKTLGETEAPNAIYYGAVVKVNGPADRTVRTYLRAPTGLLVDVTAQLRDGGKPESELKKMLVACIATAAADGHPFTYSGETGVYNNRQRLPVAFHNMGDKKLRAMLDEMLEARPQIIVKGRAKGSSAEKWLDVPDGPFARGVGELALGAGDAA
jgi:hypothetical protein